MPRDQYRTRHKNAPRPSDAHERGRSYVESPATMEREFEEALERNRQRLDEQREEFKRRRQI